MTLSGNPTESQMLSDQAISRPAKSNVRWTICALLFFATSINYMDRQVLSLLAPMLQHSIGWTEAQYGYIIGAFQAAYAIGLVVAGRMVDKLGTRIGYAVIMGIWSLAAMSHALARSAFGFGIARFFLGLGESGNFPAAIKTTAEWFPQSERSLATGIFNSGANVGAVLAPAIIPWITLRFGWRAAFLTTGIFSLSWIIWWLTHYHKPTDHPKVSTPELEHIVSDPFQPTAQISWGKLFVRRQTWAFSLAKFLTDPFWWFYLFWLPKFFNARFHLDLSHLGLPLIVVYNASAVGSIGGGWLPALFHRKSGVAMTKARLTAMLLYAFAVVPIFFAGHTNSEWVAVALLSLAAAAHQAWSANLFTTASDMFPKSAVGGVVGIGGMAGSVGGFLLSITAGKILEITHSYASLFAMAASAYLIAYFILNALAPGLKRVEV
ncbi:MAG TPA: MFS transporter [Pseudacidobacterium sp.]|jgi:ACS family hexuronate transporter-like MFS transporter|nr:MFS transporter [Pseudacidobacterium sp.]